MNKAKYIELYGYISNSELKRAIDISRTLCIDIKDYKLPLHEKLIERYIQLMIELRLHLKHNCISNFKDNFYSMNVNKGKVYAVNYTGHTLEYDGNKFYGDYKFCIHKNKKPINKANEQLYFIDGSYPMFSITSFLDEDIKRVIATNSSWRDKEVKAVLVEAYQKSK